MALGFGGQAWKSGQFAGLEGFSSKRGTTSSFQSAETQALPRTGARRG